MPVIYIYLSKIYIPPAGCVKYVREIFAAEKKGLNILNIYRTLGAIPDVYFSKLRGCTDDYEPLNFFIFAGCARTIHTNRRCLPQS